ncbi:MAG TPA: hypothetical protein VFV73_10455 [Streptosporangiaceae bacterium]|nr:hypothetical protein [Streptosporangiaceae bacterium]
MVWPGADRLGRGGERQSRVHLGDGGPDGGAVLPVSLAKVFGRLRGEFFGSAEMFWSGHQYSSCLVRYRIDTARSPGNGATYAGQVQQGKIAGKDPAMEALTPASADDLPPLGELVADDLFWRYPAGGLAREGAARLRVWLTARREAGYLAVVTETGTAASVTESAGRIRALLARRYGPSVVLLEHYPAPESGEGAETLDLVRVGADGSPHWTRVWPTREDNPRHAGLERWMATDGHRIVSKPASWFNRCEDD